MRFPNTISINTFKSYIHLKNCISTDHKKLNAFNLEWDCNSPDSLKILCIQTIAENWLANPIYSEIEFPEDRNYLLDILNVNYPMSEICNYIKADVFWKRSFKDKWKICPEKLANKNQKWIQKFLERYLSETIETLKASDYDPEMMVTFIELCAPYVEELKINRLQASLTDSSDHIPFNIILPNLSELKYIDLTFDCKNIGTNFYLGCSNLTQNDVKYLASGLEKCYELRKFRICGTKLEPYTLKLLARSLEKGCPYLESIQLPHCRTGDIGLMSFVDVLGRDAFPNLKEIVLTNNFISQEGALELADVMKYRQIEKLNLRLNPLTSDGTAAIFSVIPNLQLQELNLACCSIDDTIDPLLIKLFRTNKTLNSIDLSTNKLGNEIGENLLKLFQEKLNSVSLCKFDIRNTGISGDIRIDLEEIILNKIY